MNVIKINHSGFSEKFHCRVSQMETYLDYLSLLLLLLCFSRSFIYYLFVTLKGSWICINSIYLFPLCRRLSLSILNSNFIVLLLPFMNNGTHASIWFVVVVVVVFVRWSICSLEYLKFDEFYWLIFHFGRS